MKLTNVILYLSFGAVSAQANSSAILEAASATDWTGYGGNIYNNHWASTNNDVHAHNVKSLTTHCSVEYEYGVSATPVIHGNMVYYPTWNGLFVALNYHNCQVQWQLNVTKLVTEFGPLSSGQQAVMLPVSRTSPQIDGDVLFFGTLIHALLFAVDRHTGDVLARTQVHDHPYAELTMSPTFYDGKLYIGVSSAEESAADYVPGFVCCSFQSTMMAYKYKHASQAFSVAWNVSMIQGNTTGWSGVAIWGSQPAIDIARRQVFIATGNVYTVPEVIQECQNQSQSIAAVAQGLTSDPCLPPDVYQESVLALDLDTGLINWAVQLSALDAWTVACGYGANLTPNKANCPFMPGPDADFGMAPTFIPGSKHTPYGKDIVVIGQKNGNLYALSAQAGRTFWNTVTSPDGVEGGLIWGVASDNKNIYFTAVNTAQSKFTLQPSGTVIRNSAIGAVRFLDGAILWETQITPATAFSLVPPTIVNDVVISGRTSNNASASDGVDGQVIMVNKNGGNVVRTVDVGANFHGGIAVQDGFVLFGTGYNGYSVTKGALVVMSL